MTHQVRSCCAWSVLFFFLFTLLAPDDAYCFDTDALKTAGIVTGITIGVALVVILVAGTMRDFKKDRREEHEDDDVWSHSPVLRTLGYRPMDDPLFGLLSGPSEDLLEEGLAARKQVEAFLEGKIDASRPTDRDNFRARHTTPFRLGGAAEDWFLPDLVVPPEAVPAGTS